MTDARQVRQISSEEYFSRPDVVREYASFDFLLPPERAILGILEPRLSTARMLDLGVGGGRTSLHLAPRVASYVGVDSSEEMIAACNERFAAAFENQVSYEVGDARDLSRFPRGSFDFVLFAFQGLDSITTHDERLRVLDEIRLALAPGGIFAFSSDNLAYLRAALSLRRVIERFRHAGDHRAGLLGLARRSRRTVRNLTWTIRLRRLNRTVMSSRVRHGRHVYLRRPYELSDVGYSKPNELIEIDGYAIEPEEQVAQLTSAGFRDVRLFTSYGVETRSTGEELRRSQWVYYLCHRGDGPGLPAASAARAAE